MNYYHELLVSYSKLKNRSLKLLKEQDTGKSKAQTDVDSEIKKALPQAEQAAQVVLNDRQGQYHEGSPYTPAEAPNVNIYKTQKGKVMFSLGGGWSSALYAADGTSTYKEGSLLKGTSAWGKFVRQFVSKSEKGAKGADKDRAETHQQQTADAQTQNEEALKDIMSEFGLASKDGATAQISNELDYFDNDQQNYQNGFRSHIERVFKELIKDTTIPIQAKLAFAQTIKDLVSLAVRFRKMEESGEKIGPSDLMALNKLMRDVQTQTIVGQEDPKTKERLMRDGGLVMAGGVVGMEEHQGFEFGLGKNKEMTKSVALMWDTINETRRKYNEDVDNADPFYSIPDATEVFMEETDVPGSTANKRAEADESLMAGAGMVDLFMVGQKSCVEDPNSSECEEAEFAKGKMRDMVDNASKYFPEFSITFAIGTGLMNDEGVSTLRSTNAQEQVEAVINRLTLDYPDDFPDEETARQFAEELAQDTEGFKAFATILLLRYSNIKNIFGDQHSPVLSVAGGTRWSKGSKNYRRKIDVAYFFDASDYNEEAGSSKTAEELKDRLKGFVGAGEDVAQFVETKTVQDFIDDGILLTEDLSPALSEMDDEGKYTKRITLAAVSVKTLSNDGKSINLGSNAAKSLTAPTGATGYKENEGRIEVHNLIRDNLPGGSNATITSLHQMYKAVEEQGLNANATQKEVFNQIMKNASSSSKASNRTADAAVIDLLLLGGTSREPQLNVTTATDTGSFSAESDEAFRDKILKGVKSGSISVHYGGRELVDGEWPKDNSGEGTRQAFIVEKLKPPKSGANADPRWKTHSNGHFPIARVYSSPKEGRTDVQKTADYHRTLEQHSSEKRERKSGAENSSTMLRQFLSAQAQMIQEFLAAK
jgi:hypothetical protein